jgi:Flp pilus assembly protein TadG
MIVNEQETAVTQEMTKETTSVRLTGRAQDPEPKQSLAARLRELLTRDDSGSALAEMAFIVVPLMVTMITGLVWFGIALNSDLALNNAVQSGSEQLALLRGNAADPCAVTATDVGNAAPGLTPSQLNFTITLGGTPYAGSGTSGSSAPSCNGVTMTSGETAVLTVTYPVTINVFGWGAHSYIMSASTAELIQ